jgi:hypothetical protein
MEEVVRLREFFGEQAFPHHPVLLRWKYVAAQVVTLVINQFERKNGSGAEYGVRGSQTIRIRNLAAVSH